MKIFSSGGDQWQIKNTDNKEMVFFFFTQVSNIAITTIFELFTMYFKSLVISPWQMIQMKVLVLLILD